MWLPQVICFSEETFAMEPYAGEPAYVSVISLPSLCLPLVWHCLPLWMKSKGLVKYRYLSIGIYFRCRCLMAINMTVTKFSCGERHQEHLVLYMCAFTNDSPKGAAIVPIKYSMSLVGTSNCQCKLSAEVRNPSATKACKDKLVYHYGTDNGWPALWVEYYWKKKTYWLSLEMWTQRWWCIGLRPSLSCTITFELIYTPSQLVNQ